VKTRSSLWFLVPVVVAILGSVWMQVAVSHFEHTTGRKFYGLVGHHYSVPELGFTYHSGGEFIHRWTTKIPPAATLILLLASLGAAIASERKSGWPIITGIVATHVLVAVAFALLAGWYDINVTGVFI
jgi:hypothetical protein